MPHNFHCPQCNSPLDASENRDGDTIYCRHCAQSVMVPVEPQFDSDEKARLHPIGRLMRLVMIFLVLVFAAGTIGRFWANLWDDPAAEQAEAAKERNSIAYRLANISYAQLPLAARFPESPPHNVPTTWVQSIMGKGPGSRMQLRILLPPGEHARNSLGCVVMAPTKTTVLAGCTVSPGDPLPEAMPFVEAGYAVIVFSIDGQLPEDALDLPEEKSSAAIGRAHSQFRSACYGVVNGRNAVEYARRNLFLVDQRRIYVAGEDAAGTVALLLAEHEPRLAGCIALHPCIDVEARAKQHLASWSYDNPEQTPRSHADQIRCPLFLFAAQGDSAEEAAEFEAVESFSQQLKTGNANVTFAQVESSVRQETLKEAGIPQAIAWLKQLDAPLPASETPSEVTPPLGDN